MKKDKVFIKVFISVEKSRRYIFWDPGTPCTGRHCRTDRNNTPCKDAF